jgi:hypothetical protein
MTYRRYHRKCSAASKVLSDTSYIANRLSWKSALIFGVVSFLVFYWLIPMWLNHHLASLQNNMFRPVMEVLFAKRIHWFQWVGIALGLICTFFAIRNYFAAQRFGSVGERNVSLFSRILAKWLD